MPHDTVQITRVQIRIVADLNHVNPMQMTADDGDGRRARVHGHPICAGEDVVVCSDRAGVLHQPDGGDAVHAHNGRAHKHLRLQCEGRWKQQQHFSAFSSTARTVFLVACRVPTLTLHTSTLSLSPPLANILLRSRW